MNTFKDSFDLPVSLQPISESDLPFLFELYVSSRAEEFKHSGWSSEELNNFLKKQFELQHTQYMQNYNNPTFDLIQLEQKNIGRLYVNRDNEDIRIIDIAVMPDYRQKGVAKFLMESLIREAAQKSAILSLHVEHNNPILDWYAHLGFKPIRDVGVYKYMTLTPEAHSIQNSVQ